MRKLSHGREQKAKNQTKKIKPKHLLIILRSRTTDLVSSFLVSCSSVYYTFELAHLRPLLFFEPFLPLPANQIQAFAFFQALYRIMNHSLPAAVLPCGGSSFRVRARAKKSPSRSVPLEGAARLVETPVGESERRQSKLFLSAALSFTCGVALAHQSSNVQACYHYEW